MLNTARHLDQPPLVLMCFAVNSFVAFLHGNPFVDDSSHTALVCAPLQQQIPDKFIAALANKVQATTLEIKSCVKNSEYQNIHLLPFYDVTEPLYSMHLNGFRPSILNQMLAPGLILNFTPLLMSWC
jgi:hypothetical protein